MLTRINLCQILELFHREPLGQQKPASIELAACILESEKRTRPDLNYFVFELNSDINEDEFTKFLRQLAHCRELGFRCQIFISVFGSHYTAIDCELTESGWSCIIADGYIFLVTGIFFITQRISKFLKTAKIFLIDFQTQVDNISCHTYALEFILRLSAIKNLHHLVSVAPAKIQKAMDFVNEVNSEEFRNFMRGELAAKPTVRFNLRNEAQMWVITQPTALEFAPIYAYTQSIRAFDKLPPAIKKQTVTLVDHKVTVKKAHESNLRNYYETYKVTDATIAASIVNINILLRTSEFIEGMRKFVSQLTDKEYKNIIRVKLQKIPLFRIKHFIVGDLSRLDYHVTRPKPSALGELNEILESYRKRHRSM